MKLTGLILFIATCLFGFLNFSEISFWSAGIGSAVAIGFFILLTAFKTEAPPVETQSPWEGRFHDLEADSNRKMEGLSQEVQKLQQRLLRSEERCASYQNLVDAHQNEIDKLKLDNQYMGEQLIEKERKISQLELARVEPDLFDTEKRKMDSAFRELKKEFEDKTHALELSRAKLFRAEAELRTLKVPSQSQDLFG